MLKRRLGQLIKADGQQSLSLKQKVIRGAVWTLSGHGMNQVLRLGGNLILTRLLFPEAFGLMALVQLFIQGLEMFSDTGAASSIIQNKRGNEPAFLNTAWTLQVGRGFMLWVGSYLIAWPAAQFYNEPMLTQLLPVSGVTSFIAGLNSTKLFTANRQLVLGRLTLVELGSYTVGLVLMIIWAWIYRSVWALVGGAIVAALVKMVLSHTAFDGERNRFYWEPEAFRALHQFGRWIFFSTALTFLAGQSDRLILARLVNVRFLGIYTVAQTLSRALSIAIHATGSRVLFPSYAELVRERPEQLYLNLRKTRLILIALSYCVSLVFIIFGQQLIDFFYDNRYADAGWMLQFFAVGSLVSILAQTYDNVLMANGQTFAIAALLVIQLTVQVTAMFLGAHWGGHKGVIIGLVSTEWILYSSQAIWLARLSLWQPEIDLPFLALASGLLAILLFN